MTAPRAHPTKCSARPRTPWFIARGQGTGGQKAHTPPARWTFFRYTAWDSLVVLGGLAHFSLVVGGLVFSLAMGLLGGFFPAARAARLKIINALREI